MQQMTEDCRDEPAWIVPDWPCPAHVQARVTTRKHGVSRPPYDSFNLALHVGDDPGAVAQNRLYLRRFLPGDPVWLNQVHGTNVYCADHSPLQVPEADASYATHSGRVCAVLTADCLPVLLTDRQGSVVAAAHAGWRGLLGGVLEATIRSMQVPASELMAWLGPAIGRAAFEVGDEVRQMFVADMPEAAVAFSVGVIPGKWFADLHLLAKWRLQKAGVSSLYGTEWCTVADSERWYSYRREHVTGRMASLIWLTDNSSVQSFCKTD